MEATEIVKQYFDYLNSGNNEGMVSLLDKDVTHEVNQGDTRKGTQLFKEFMKHMDSCYKENIRDLVVLSNPNSKNRVSTEFIVDGTYLKTDKGLPEARNQKYSVRAGTFFEIHEGKISRITTYYNLPQWIRAVQ